MIGAGQYLDECGFTCAVFTEQGMDFAAFEREIDMVKCGDAQKGFGDRARFEKRYNRRLLSACFRASHGSLPFANCNDTLRRDKSKQAGPKGNRAAENWRPE